MVFEETFIAYKEHVSLGKFPAGMADKNGKSRHDLWRLLLGNIVGVCDP